MSNQVHSSLDAGGGAAQTGWPAADRVIGELLGQVKAILAEKFYGLYLYGSLASGGFDPAHSDIDFLVVTTGPLSEDEVDRLRALHAALAASDLPMAAKLEGTYLPVGDLARYRPGGGPYPCVNEGQFYLSGHDCNWIIQRHVLREMGLTVTGPAINDKIDPISPRELTQAVRDLLAEWWEPMLTDSSRLESGEYQAYAVQTMCRCLYTLEQGKVGSKGDACGWARTRLGLAWARVIDWSRAWQPGDPGGHLEEARELIRLAVHCDPADQTGQP
jgi:predicted nucleotidyltransferase